MADSSDVKKMLRHVLDKLTSLETKLTAVDRELSTVKLDQRRAAYPVELRLPEYDGSDDPEVWLHRFEIFFRLQRTEDDDEKVNLAAFHMTGAAQTWYCALERNGGVASTWPQFAESVRRRFGEVARLRHHDGLLTEQEVADIFIAGLRDPELRAHLEQLRPATFEEAGRLAIALEHRYN